MLSRVRSALRNLLHRRQVESELDAEIRSYVDALVDEKTAVGFKIAMICSSLCRVPFICGSPLLFWRTHILGGPVSGGWVITATDCQQRTRTESVLRDNSEMKLQVQCYAGSKGDERPVRFRVDHRE